MDSAILTILQAIQNPQMLLPFLSTYVLLCLTRIISISLVALNAPIGLIALIDPLSNAFYGAKFITKDLFFSGHTATVFLMGLCLITKKEKIIIFVATSVVPVFIIDSARTLHD